MGGGAQSICIKTHEDKNGEIITLQVLSSFYWLVGQGMVGITILPSSINLIFIIPVITKHWFRYCRYSRGQNKNLCPEETYILVKEERDIKQKSKINISHNIKY